MSDATPTKYPKFFLYWHKVRRRHIVVSSVERFFGPIKNIGPQNDFWDNLTTGEGFQLGR